MSSRFFVRRADAGRPLQDWLCERLSLSRPEVRRLLREKRVRIAGVPCEDPARRLCRGQLVEVRAWGRQECLPTNKADRNVCPTAPRAREGPHPVVRFADAQVVVVDKPAGLTTVRHADEVAEFGKRARRFLPPTLADLLPGLLARGGRPAPVRAVHRLDKETSGLVVFARTPEAESHLGKQFRAHTVERSYLAVVRGRAREGRIESRLVRDRGDGRRGSTSEPGAGQQAVTHVRLLEALGEYSLVECRLETGRTHQVRIHLGEAGTPLCGDRVYDRPPHGRPVHDASGFARIALHAAVLGFEHPATGQRLRWTSPLPADMAGLVRRLRREARGGGGASAGRRSS
jgi:23S rRNA pseudouridine1911/1915/1917 synthase